MARLHRHHDGYVIVAQTEAELDLLAHACRAEPRREGDAEQPARGELILLEAYYLVHENTLLLPHGISDNGALRVCLALQEAARSHQEARERRRRFRLVKQ